MTKISLVANDQLLVVAAKPTVSSGDQNADILHVNFSAEWNAFPGKSAVFFTSLNTTPYERVLVSGECVIPTEVLASPCTLYIGVKGVNSDNQAVKTSSLVKYKIVDGTPVDDGIPVPTNDVYQQLLTAYGKTNAALDLLTKKKYVFIGDSYGAGWIPTEEDPIYGTTVKSWIQFTCEMLGLNESDYWQASKGGSCFGNVNNSFTSLLYSIIGQTTEAERQTVTDIVVGGGRNETDFTNEAISSGVTDFFNLARATFPNATVHVIALGWDRDHVIRERLQSVYDGIYSTVGAVWYSCKYCEIYPCLQNRDFFAIDGKHPNEYGEKYLGFYVSRYLLGNPVECRFANVYVNCNGVGIGFLGLRHSRAELFINKGVSLEVNNLTLSDNGTIVGEVDCPLIYGVEKENTLWGEIPVTMIVKANNVYKSCKGTISFVYTGNNSNPQLEVKLHEVNSNGTEYLTLTNVQNIAFPGGVYTLPILSI